MWGARGLLHVFAPSAIDSVVAGLADPSWRVREMCAKVVRAHEVGAAAAAAVTLCQDEVPRVRVAAVRALAVVGEAVDADAVRRLVDDVERPVVSAARRALHDMSSRLDRDLVNPDKARMGIRRDQFKRT